MGTLLTMRETAKWLGFEYEAFRRKVASGQVPHLLVGTTRRFDPDEVRDALRQPAREHVPAVPSGVGG